MLSRILGICLGSKSPFRGAPCTLPAAFCTWCLLSWSSLKKSCRSLVRLPQIIAAAECKLAEYDSNLMFARHSRQRWSKVSKPWLWHVLSSLSRLVSVETTTPAGVCSKTCHLCHSGPQTTHCLSGLQAMLHCCRSCAFFNKCASFQ